MATHTKAPVIIDGFAEVVLPHLQAGYRLARWLLRNEEDAQDVVQEASLRAWRYFGTFTGGNGRAWFLRIVRNTCVGLRHQGRTDSADLFDEQHHSHLRPVSSPETLLLQTDRAMLIERAMNSLSERSRELLRLREMEGLSYKEIADVRGIPIGTVMSGLARARRALREALTRVTAARAEGAEWARQTSHEPPPPQLGQTFPITCSTHVAQNVHS
jgi:RNA polymerase sigma-70 factor, ECF subfamily